MFPQREFIESLSTNTHVQQQANYKRIGVMVAPLLASLPFFLQGQIAKKVTITLPCNKVDKIKP